MMDSDSETTYYGVGGGDQPPASLVVRLIDLLKEARNKSRLSNNLVLDYGCGKGRNIECFREASFRVIATEIFSAPHFSDLKKVFANDKNVTFIPLEDIHNLNLRFAAVAALASIHHDFKPEEAIRLLQSITLPGGFHAVFVFTVESQPPWIKLGVQSSLDDPYRLTVLSPFGPNELLTYYQQKEWQVLYYEEGINEDDTRNMIGPDQYEPEHSHSFARILAKKI